MLCSQVTISGNYQVGVLGGLLSRFNFRFNEDERAKFLQVLSGVRAIVHLPDLSVAQKFIPKPSSIILWNGDRKHGTRVNIAH